MDLEQGAIMTLSPNAIRYNNLKAEAKNAIAIRDAIDNCSSPEWRKAHKIARAASLQSSNDTGRLARVPPYAEGLVQDGDRDTPTVDVFPWMACVSRGSGPLKDPTLLIGVAVSDPLVPRGAPPVPRDPCLGLPLL